MDKDISYCTCNQDSSSFSFSNSFRFLFPTRDPCWRSLSWEKHCEFPEDHMSTYSKLLKLQETASSPDIHQIDLDLNRTFPTTKHFNAEHKLSLRRILVCVSLYEPLVGYVQGMNFLVGSLLWHTSECKAFWLMVSLLKKYKLEMNYIPGLPGLSKHAQILELLLFEQYPNLLCYLNEHRADVSIYITEWCFTLFSKIVPITEMGLVLHEFFEHGWCFFYRLVLAIILRLKEKLLSLKDPADILTIIKPSEVYKRGHFSFLKSLRKDSEEMSWKKLIKEASKINLNKGYIEYLVSSI